MSSWRRRLKEEGKFWGRVAVLTGFKEAYFFGKNLMGMVVHPQLTTARILGRKDFSQVFLVFGLPVNLWLVLVILGGGFWWLVKPSGWLFDWGIVFFSLVSFFLLVLAVYYFYWVVKYLKKAGRLG